MKIVKIVLGFFYALPQLPGALWKQRRELVNTAAQKHVWMTEDEKIAYAKHLLEVERQRRGE